MTEALAAARSEAAVFRVVLRSAVEALGAVAASVLLSVDGELRLMAVSAPGESPLTGRADEQQAGGEQTGEEQAGERAAEEWTGGRALWQDVALNYGTPAGDALLRRVPLYFEQLGGLTARYPQLERPAGATGAVATAVLPMLLDDRPLGVLVLDFREPHTFTAPERQFLQTLAGQCAVALGRVQALNQLDAQVRARTAELEAVLDCLSDAVFVGDAGGITRVNRAGLQLLGYHSPDQLNRRLDTLSAQLQQRDPLTLARLPMRDEPFARALRGERATAEVLARRQDSGEDRLLRVAASPMLQGGLQVGAVAVVSDLTESRHALEMERGALGAFVAFTEAAGRVQDIDQLALSAFLALGRLFPGSSAALYDWRGDCWQLHAAPAAAGEPPSLGRVLAPDIPLLAQMVWTRAAAFSDADAAETGSADGAEEMSASSGRPPQTRTCAYPIVREGLIVTALVVWDGPERRWTDRDRATVTAIGRSFSLLYDRVAVASALRARQQEAEERAREAEAEREALDAFVAFSEASGQITGQEELTRAAFEVLGRLLPPHSGALYARADGRWRVQLTSSPATGTAPGDAALTLPSGSPLLSDLLWTRAPVFLDALHGEGQDFERPPGVGAGAGPGEERGPGAPGTAAYPIQQEGALVAALVVELRPVDGGAGGRWTARDRSILSAVGRSFSLLYERVGISAALQEQKREAETLTQALEAFAQLTSHLEVQGDRAALVRKAQEVVLSVLPSGVAVYYEPEPQGRGPQPAAGEGRWQVRAQLGEALSAEMQRQLDAGLDRQQFRSLSLPWERGEPLYQDTYDPAADQSGVDRPEVAQAVSADSAEAQAAEAQTVTAQMGAVASLPLLQGGAPVGVFTVALKRPHPWSRADRALLEGVLRALALALARVEGVAQLAQRSLELERSNAALSGANDELEAFAYSASHDLRTPVRHVLGFADLAEQALGAGIPDKAVRYLGVMRGAATRMNTLIDAMLLLSRAGRRVFRTEVVPLSGLVEQARQDVAAEFPGWPVEWRVSPLPSVQGDRDTLQQVMTNLISNAVKYSRRGVGAGEGAAGASVIEIWAERGLQEVRVSVRDNGVGFDPRYQDKLFGVFQRLHSQEEFQGTGVGLAIVKRIVSRYGGQVFAEGRPGRGATFGFTLPLPGRARAPGLPVQAPAEQTAPEQVRDVPGG